MHALPCYTPTSGEKRMHVEILRGGAERETSFDRASLAQIAGVQPGVQHSDRIIKTVGIADGDKRLTAGNRAGARQRIEAETASCELSQCQPGLVAQPGVPARRCCLEPPRLLVERQQQQ
jgi:hypothetical protein